MHGGRALASLAALLLCGTGRAQVPERLAAPPDLADGGAPLQGVEIQEVEEDKPLTLEELVNVEVTTASNRLERSGDAPAWTLVFTGEELRARGYQELTDLLDDLPGMDVIRPWGDTYFKTYWRGYRNYVGEPFLLLVDGVVFNHLWLGDAQLMAAIPLSNIERVEVVNGPASALYGPNAAMGVINVITRRSLPEGTGAEVRARMGLRSPQGSVSRVEDMTKTGDFSALYQGPGFRVSVTGRFDVGVVDPALSERFEWLKEEYYTDTADTGARLWGDVLKYPSLAGSFHSPSEKQALDARFVLEHRDDEARLTGETEVAAQLYRMLNGTGLVYPADRSQSRTPWTVREQSLWVRHRQDMGDSLESTTLLRYRRSNVDDPTAYLSRDPESAADQSIDLAYYEAPNSSLSLSQGFHWLAGQDLMVARDALSLDWGLQYERRDLARTYEVSRARWGPQTPFTGVPGTDAPFPEPLAGGIHLDNRLNLDVLGMYLLSRYDFLEDHALHLGLRVDYNTLFNLAEPTFRGGYVGHFPDGLTVKLLYGQALEEPSLSYFSDKDGNARVLSGLRLLPERSQTVELGLGYPWRTLVFQGELYYVRSGGAVVGDERGDERRVAGADLGVTALFHPEGVRQVRVWGYYSTYLLARRFNPAAPQVVGNFEDLARHKLLAGATLDVNRSVGLTVLGRCFSRRVPVSTNPLGAVAGYCVVDANLLLQDLFVDGLSLQARVTNVLDTRYDHPGLEEADSGNTPGRADENGFWVGSQGDFNSRLPQPGRAFAVQLGLDL